MNNNLLCSFLISMALLLVFSACSYTGLGKLEHSIRPTPVEEAFSNYWKFSQEGDAQSLSQTITDPPLKYFDCYSDTKEVCDSRKNNPEREINPKTGRPYNKFAVTYFEPTIREKIPDGIQLGNWKSYSVQRQIIAGNEARLQIVIDIGSASFRRDVLLYEKDGNWKVFAIVDPDDHQPYAFE